MKCAIYIRVSTVHQTDRDSLPQQRQELTSYADMFLHSPYEVFEDAGFSGKNTARPAFQDMMRRVRKGEFTHVLVWKIDRISRNLIDFATMYDEFKRLNVAFVSLNEQFDTSTAMGGAMLKIILVFAELERNMTSERVTAVMINRANNAEWNGGKIPYGYQYDGSFKIDDKEAVVVKMIYSMYLSSGSILNVVRTLNSRGLRTRQGKEWTTTTVHKMLTSPFYVGDYRYNASHERKGSNKTAIKSTPDEWIVHENHHEAIIPRDIQKQVKAMLSQNQRGKHARLAKETHIFAGVLTCGCCGGTMQAQKGRKSERYTPSVYGCVNRKKGSCGNTFSRDVDFAPFVFNYVANMIKAQTIGKGTDLETFQEILLHGRVFDDVEYIEPKGLLLTHTMAQSEPDVQYAYTHENALFSPSDNSGEEISILTSEKRKIERSKKKLLDLYASSDSLTFEDYNAKQEELTATLSAIEARIAEIKAPTQDEDVSYFNLSQALLSDYIDFDSLVRQVDVGMLKSFIKKVIKRISIDHGRITEIEFSNGSVHKFCYE